MLKKIFILFVCINFITFAFAQDNKEAKKHKEKIEKSFKKQSAEVSLDTLFYKGLPYCIYKVTDKSFLGPSEMTVYSLKTNTECFKIAMIAEGEGTNTKYFWKWIVTLPNNNTNFVTPQSKMPHDLVAKYNILNDSTINETGVKNLVNMEAVDKTVKVVIVQPSNKPLIIERDRTATIFVIHETIKQDNKIIGTIKQANKTSNGKMTEFYMVYNSNNVLIATAENEEFMGHHWHVVTAINQRTWHLNSSTNEDKNDIVKYLIEGLYL